MSQGFYQDRVKNWKSKAISRRKKIDSLKRRNKELIDNRDSWQEKYKLEKSAHKKVFFKVKKLKDIIII